MSSRGDYDGPCHAFAPLIEQSGGPKLARTFPAGKLQRFAIKAPGVFAASLVSYPPGTTPEEADPAILTPEAIVPIHLVPDPDRAKAVYGGNEAEEIGLWHAAFIAAAPGPYTLVIRLRQQSSIVEEPDLCTPLASYPAEDMKLVTAKVNYSDPQTGSAYMRELRTHCGWEKNREHWFDVMKRDPRRPANVPWHKSLVFSLEVSVTEARDLGTGPAIPGTAGVLSPDLEKLFRLVYQPSESTSPSTIADDLRLFSLGTFHPPPADVPPPNGSRPTPGDPWIRPHVQTCPFVFERHAVSANCSARPGHLHYLPLFAQNRTDWLMPRDRMLRCIREERFKIVGDSLAGLFSSGLGCTCLVYGGRCKWEVMDDRGQKGQAFPLHYFASLEPPEGSEPTRDLFEFLAKAEWGAGVELWQLGAWPVAYTNSTTWNRGFELLLSEMGKEIKRGKAGWDDWKVLREQHREKERRRVADEIEEIADAKRRVANGEVGLFLKVQKEQYLRSLKRVPFKELEPVPEMPRRFIMATSTPFQTLLAPLEYLRTPGFQTLGRAIKYNHALLQAFEKHRTAGGKVEMVDTFRLLEQRFDARTDNAHYCPGANWEVAMVLWHALCKDVD